MSVVPGSPSTPAQATFPVPPPLANLQLINPAGFPTPVFLEFLQILWAAIQGGGGLIDQLTSNDAAAEATQDPNSFNDVAAQVESLRSDVSNVLAQLDQIEAADGLREAVASIAQRLDDLAVGQPPVTLGTLSVQNFDLVSITGGAIAAATIGANVDNGTTLTNQTSDAGAHTGTLTNSPATGNPAFWLRIKVNATNYALPLWTA